MNIPILPQNDQRKVISATRNYLQPETRIVQRKPVSVGSANAPAVMHAPKKTFSDMLQSAVKREFESSNLKSTLAPSKTFLQPPFNIGSDGIKKKYVADVGDHRALSINKLPSRDSTHNSTKRLINSSASVSTSLCIKEGKKERDQSKYLKSRFQHQESNVSSGGIHSSTVGPIPEVAPIERLAAAPQSDIKANTFMSSLLSKDDFRSSALLPLVSKTWKPSQSASAIAVGWRDQTINDFAVPKIDLTVDIENSVDTAQVEASNESSFLKPLKEPYVTESFARPEILRSGEISTNFIRKNLKGKGSYRQKQPLRDRRQSHTKNSDVNYSDDSSSLSEDDHDTATHREGATDKSVGLFQERGSSFQMGIDPLQLTLSTIDSVTQNQQIKPAVSSSFASRNIDKSASKTTSLLEKSLPVSFQNKNDPSRPLFIVSKTELLCKEVVTSHKKKTAKGSMKPMTGNRDLIPRKSLGQRGKKSKVGAAELTVEDEWLEKFAPKCTGHEMPAKLLVVKKTGANKGRRFYGCTFPMEQRCNFFLWAENNPELVSAAVRNSRWNSGATSNVNTSVVAPEDPVEKWRQFAIETYHKHLLTLDSTELKDEIKKQNKRLSFSTDKNRRKLNVSGTKEELIRRLVEEAYFLLLEEDLLFGSDTDEYYVNVKGTQSDQEFELSLSESESDSSAPLPKRKRINDTKKMTRNISRRIEESDDSDLAEIISTSSDGDIHDSVSLDSSLGLTKDNPTSLSNFCEVTTVRQVGVGELSVIERNVSKPAESNFSVELSEDCSSEADDSDDSLVIGEADERNFTRNEKLAEKTPTIVFNEKMSVNRVRKCCFGFDSFRPGQRWAIDRTLSGLSSLLVLPTGAGKSLCFFLPALILGGGAQAAKDNTSGLTIVVSPLISLMQDQLRKLPVHLPGACFSSGMSAVEGSNLTCAILNGLVRILFVSPERLCTQSFRNLIKTLKRRKQESWLSSNRAIRDGKTPITIDNPVALLCVDEAHCLSQWSFNFRPSFLRIRREIMFIRPRAVIALTATATPDVQRDIAYHLSISNDGIFTTPPARYNLSLNVSIISDTLSKNEIVIECLKKYGSTKRKRNKSNSTRFGMSYAENEVDIPDNTAEVTPGSTIVYVWRRYETEALVDYLKGNGISAAPYHAGMDSQERMKTQHLFNSGAVDVVVATVAFGMGVDKSNVRCIVHTVAPKSVENYIQEIGRAGRDGDSSECLLLLDRSDIISQYSLSHTTQVSEAQLVVMMLYIFHSVFSVFMGDKDILSQKNMAEQYKTTLKEQLLSVNIDEMLNNFIVGSGNSETFSAAVSLNTIEQKSDISAAAAETVLAVLELSPFNFIQVDSSRLDTITGRFRSATSASQIDRTDVIVNAIITLNKFKSAKKGAPLNNSSVKKTDRYGMMSDNALWDDAKHISDDDNTSGTNNRDSASYSGVEFIVSLMDIANFVRMDTDEVSTALYILQKKGVLSYTMSDPMIYITILKNNISEDIKSYFNCSKFLWDIDESRLLDLPVNNLLCYFWMRHAARRVGDILNFVVKDAACRVMDMWRIGSIISATLNIDITPGKHVAQSSNVDKISLSEEISELTLADKQKLIMNFLCHYMSHLAPKQKSSTVSSAGSILYAPENIQEAPNIEGGALLEFEHLFHTVCTPIIQVSMDYTAYKVIMHRMATHSCSDIQAPSSDEKWCLTFWRDMIVLASHPNIAELVKSVLSAADQNRKIPFILMQSNLLLANIQYYTLDLVPLFIARIFHGLSSNKLNMNDWAPSGYWGKYKNVNFQDILNSTKDYLNDKNMAREPAIF